MSSQDHGRPVWDEETREVEQLRYLNSRIEAQHTWNATTSTLRTVAAHLRTSMPNLDGHEATEDRGGSRVAPLSAPPRTYMRTMIDHLGWINHGHQIRRLFADDARGCWLVSLDDEATRVQTVAGGSMAAPIVRVLPVAGLPLVLDLPELFWILDGVSPVARFANPSLWDAVATAIVRQVVRADTATKLYHRFCATHGTRRTFGGFELAAFPSPEVVLGLSDAQFAASGMTFKRDPLRSAAEAFCKSARTWRELPPADLVTCLQEVPHVGPWTAGAAVADWSNDFSVYPYSDLAVRTWAHLAVPAHEWPDSESAFARLWLQLAGDHLCELTMLTLAWGKHHHGATAP